MSAFDASRKIVTTSPMVAASLYAGLLALLLFVVATSIRDVIGQRGEVAADVEIPVVQKMILIQGLELTPLK